MDVAKVLTGGGSRHRQLGIWVDPFIGASQMCHVDVARVLVEAGADIDKATAVRPPLYIASLKGHVDVVKVLLKAGADIDKAKDSGATPLHGLERGLWTW